MAAGPPPRASQPAPDGQVGGSRRPGPLRRLRRAGRRPAAPPRARSRRLAAQLGGDSAHPRGDVSGPGDRPRRLRAHPATRAVTAHRRQPRPARPLRRRGHRSTGHPRGQLDGRPPQHAPRRRTPRPRGGAGPRRPCRSGGPHGTPRPARHAHVRRVCRARRGPRLHVSSPQPVLRRGAGPGGAAALLRRHQAGAGARRPAAPAARSGTRGLSGRRRRAHRRGPVVGVSSSPGDAGSTP